MIASLAFEAKKAELKGDGKNGSWFSPLELHVLPKIGKMQIEQVDQHDIKTCISPIWHSKGETAKKALHRLNIVIKHAAAMGLDVDIGAVERQKLCWVNQNNKSTTFLQCYGQMPQGITKNWMKTH